MRRVGLCWQQMLRKRVKWLLFKGVSECLKWSHQRIVCRELGCEARGGGGRARDCAVRTAGRCSAEASRRRRTVRRGELDSQPIEYSHVERATARLYLCKVLVRLCAGVAIADAVANFSLGRSALMAFAESKVVIFEGCRVLFLKKQLNPFTNPYARPPLDHSYPLED